MTGLFIQMTGLSGSGKSSIARGVYGRLAGKYNIEIIDGDEYREILCKDLGFSKEDRNNNIRRLGFVGRILARNGIIAIMSAINPYDIVRKEISCDLSRLVYIKCPLGVLKGRDPKGLYRRATLPFNHKDYIPNFTGISDPFEEPSDPDLIIETDKMGLNECIKILEEFILDNKGD